MKSKRILIIVMALLMLVSLVGCSSKTGIEKACESYEGFSALSPDEQESSECREALINRIKELEDYMYEHGLGTTKVDLDKQQSEEIAQFNAKDEQGNNVMSNTDIALKLQETEKEYAERER